jgi:hypothetical protein
MATNSVLEKLMGSQAKVRLLRLFILNPDDVFDSKILASRIQLKSQIFSSDLRLLCDIGFIKKTTRVVTLSDEKQDKIKRKKVSGYALVRTFPYINEIAQLLASETPLARKKLLASIKSCGKVNLLVIAGSLLHEEGSSVDVFAVGDNFKKTKVEKVLRAMEADMGRELIYALMATREFEYRYGMYDRFLKDLFDNPHEILLNKLGIG